MRRLVRINEGFPNDCIAAMFKEYFDDHEIPYMRKNREVSFIIRNKYMLYIDGGYATLLSHSHGRCYFQVSLRRKDFMDYFQYMTTYIVNTLKEEK